MSVFSSEQTSILCQFILRQRDEFSIPLQWRAIGDAEVLQEDGDFVRFDGRGDDRKAVHVVLTVKIQINRKQGEGGHFAIFECEFRQAGFNCVLWIKCVFIHMSLIYIGI